MSAEPAEQLSVWDLALRRELTIDDLPDEDEIGRTELIDGSVLLSPGPDVEHQVIAMDVAVRLTDAAPHLTVVTPVNVIADERTLVMPDVAVIDEGHLVRDGLGVAPAGVRLAVEITSSSTRLRDLSIKRELYRAWGVPLVIVDRGRTPHASARYGDLPEWAADLHG